MFKGIINSHVCKPIVPASTNLIVYFSNWYGYSQYSRVFILFPWGKGQLMRKQVNLTIKDTFRDCSRWSRVNTHHLLLKTAACLVIIGVQNNDTVWLKYFGVISSSIWNKRTFWIDLFWTCLDEKYNSLHTSLWSNVLFIVEIRLKY